MARSKYRQDQHPALVRQLIAQGCVDDRKIARAVGVAKSTLWRWTTRHEEFATAMAGAEKSLPMREIRKAKFEARARAVLAALKEARDAGKTKSANTPTLKGAAENVRPRALFATAIVSWATNTESGEGPHDV